LLRTTGGPGAVAAPVRIADPGVVGLLRPGDRVDVVAAGGSGAEAARVVARDLPVVAVPVPSAEGAAEGALVVLAAAPAVAAQLVGTASTTRLALTVHSR
jgi:pilus assembly protein CpaB